VRFLKVRESWRYSRARFSARHTLAAVVDSLLSPRIGATSCLHDWRDLGDLRWLADAKSDDEAFNRLLELYQKTYPQESKVQVSIGVGQVFNFVRKVSVSDIVFVPDPPRRMMLACKVEGSYDYKEDWKDGCDYLNRKQIKLVDGEDLVELILNHYDQLDEEYRILLPLKPRELPVTERFTMSTAS